MYKEKIINAQTGEEIWRDYTPEEIAEVENAQMLAQKEKENFENQQQIRKSALAKLANLGLTEEEIAAL